MRRTARNIFAGAAYSRATNGFKDGTSIYVLPHKAIDVAKDPDAALIPFLPTCQKVTQEIREAIRLLGLLIAIAIARSDDFIFDYISIDINDFSGPVRYKLLAKGFVDISLFVMLYVETPLASKNRSHYACYERCDENDSDSYSSPDSTEDVP